jgi:hypothetical protein
MNYRENIFMSKQTKNLIYLALVTASILMVPLVGMQFTDEVLWTLSDFVFAGVLIFGTGLLYQLATRMTGNTAYQTAVGLALAAMFVLLWITGAVGIIGDSDINMLYVGVPMVGIIGALIAGFRAPGMSLALFATAAAQALIPVVALIIGEPDFAPGVLQVFVLNAVFVVLFVGSALLFRRAVSQPNGPSVEPHLSSK